MSHQVQTITIPFSCISKWSVNLFHTGENIWKKLFNPLPQILASSNLAAKENMISRIWTNGVQLSHGVEIIVGKGEVACYKQFLLFP